MGFCKVGFTEHPIKYTLLPRRDGNGVIYLDYLHNFTHKRTFTKYTTSFKIAAIYTIARTLSGESF
jgi:hypothetical protein